MNAAPADLTQLLTAIVDHLTSAYQLKSKDWTTSDEEILNALLRVISNVPDGMEIKAEHLETAGLPTIDTHSTTTFAFIVDWYFLPSKQKRAGYAPLYVARGIRDGSRER